MTYLSTKTYGHNVGLTCTFRQWKAIDSHCRFLHGYALRVKFVFSAEELDWRNWVVDFGALKSLKGWLEDWFDHKTLVAVDDPYLLTFKTMHSYGMIDMREVPATGCEKFAEFIYEFAEGWLTDNGFAPRCQLVSVEVAEHEGNSALFTKEKRI